MYKRQLEAPVHLEESSENAARTYVVMVWGGGLAQWGALQRDSYIWRRQERSGPHVRVNGLVRRPEELYVGIPALEGSRREAART